MRASRFWILTYFLIAFAFFGARPLGEPDEGRYAETAREILVSGNLHGWLVPHLQGVEHLTKPPMAYWLMAAGMRVLGVNAWGARLFLSLAFLLTILCVVELARTWGLQATAAHAAGLVFATALVPFLSGHLLTTDMFLTLTETFGVLALWKVWRGYPHSWAWRWGFWLVFGLAFLTKGPPGWLPLLVAVIFSATARMHRPQARIFTVAPFIAFIFLSLSWYLLIIVQDHSKLHYFLVDEVVNRVATNQHGREEGWYFYLVTVSLGLTPWIFIWPALIRRTLINIKPELAGRGAFPSFDKLRLGVHEAWQTTHTRHELSFLEQFAAFFGFLRFMLVHSFTFAAFKVYHFWHRVRRAEDIKFFSFLWFFVPLVIFQLSKSKMFFYVVPLFVPLSIWAGHQLVRWKPALFPPEARIRKWVYPVVLLWFAAALTFVLFPDSPRTANFLSDLAAQLRDYSRKTPVKTIYCVGDVRNSLTFYSGITVEELTDKMINPGSAKGSMNAKEAIRYLRATPRTGAALLLLKKEKLSDAYCKTIAQDGDLIIVEVGTKPPKAEK